MKKVTEMVLGIVIGMIVMVIPIMMSGCAFFSPNSRPSVLGGDADLGLIQNRTSKNVSKIADATNGTNGGSSVAEPTGGGTMTLDPAQMKSLIDGVAMRMGPTGVVPNSNQENSRGKETVRVKVKVKENTVEVYIVKRGDNLWEIARRRGVTVTELKKANGIKGTVLHIGQELKIPSR